MIWVTLSPMFLCCSPGWEQQGIVGKMVMVPPSQVHTSFSCEKQGIVGMFASIFQYTHMLIEEPAWFSLTQACCDFSCEE